MAYSEPNTHKFFLEALYKEVLAVPKVRIKIFDKIVSGVINCQIDCSTVVRNIALHIFELQETKSKMSHDKAYYLKYLIVDLINGKERDANKIINKFIIKHKEVLNKKPFLENCIVCFFCYSDYDSDTVQILKKQIISEESPLLDQQLISTNKTKDCVFKRTMIQYYADKFLSLFNERINENDVLCSDSDELEKYFDNIILHLRNFNHIAECLIFWLEDINNVKYFPKNSSASIKIRKLFNEELKSAYDIAVAESNKKNLNNSKRRIRFSNFLAECEQKKQGFSLNNN
jgi:hypothetical protein